MMMQETTKTIDLPKMRVTESDKLREWLVCSVETDEMFPTVQNGDELNVNTRKDFKNGDIVLFYDEKNEKVIIRRIYYLNGCVAFMSDNGRYEPIICNSEQKLNEFFYIGKVMNIGRYIKK